MSLYLGNNPLCGINIVCVSCTGSGSLVDVSSLQDSVTKNSEDISTLKTCVATNTTSISDITTNLNLLSTCINCLAS